MHERVLAAIEGNEEAQADGGFHCSNQTIIDETGLSPEEVASTLDQLWSAGKIEGALTMGGAWPYLMGIRRVVPGRERTWGVDGMYRPKAGS